MACDGDRISGGTAVNSVPALALEACGR